MKSFLAINWMFSFTLAMLWVSPAYAEPIRPIDDEALGYFVAAEPERKPDQARPFLGYRLRFGGHHISPGKPVRILEGKYCLELNIPSRQLKTKICDIAVQRKQTTTFPLAGISVSGDPSLFQSQIGPIFSIYLLLSEGAFTNLMFEGTSLFPAGIIPVLPGSYQAVFAATKLASLDPRLDPHLGPIKFEVKPHEIFELNLNPAEDPRTKAVVHFEKPTFPNAAAYGCSKDHQKNGAYLVWRKTGQESNMKNAGIWGLDPKDLARSPFQAYLPAASCSRYGTLQYRRFFPDKNGDSFMEVHPLEEQDGHRYGLVVNNLFLPISIIPGRQAEVWLKRIEVDQVEVTREDGTKYLQNGSYQVYRNVGEEQTPTWELLTITGLVDPASCGNGASESKFPTKTGLDVIPGIYKVVIGYSTLEGQRSQEHILDLR